MREAKRGSRHAAEMIVFAPCSSLSVRNDRAHGNVRIFMKKNALVFLGSCLFSLALVEGGARCVHTPHMRAPRMCVYGGARQPWYMAGLDVQEAGGRIHLKPGIVFQHCYDGPVAGYGHLDTNDCVTYRINTWGYRDVEHAMSKGPGVWRIMLLGDSFTFGEGVLFEDIYARVLADSLTGTTRDGREVEILNLGIPGITTGHELLTLMRMAPAIQPDLVIVQWHTNDILGEKAKWQPLWEEHHTMYERSERYEWSAAVHLVWSQYEQWRLRRLKRMLVDATYAEFHSNDRNLMQIKALNKVAGKYGCRMVLLIFPEMMDFRHYAFQGIVDDVKEFCEAEHIAYIDMVPRFAEHDIWNLIVHETDNHPNAFAHAIVAQAILDYLNARS